VLEGPRGRRVLYVAMTRCTRELHIVHSAELPAGLEDLAGSEAQPLAPEDRLSALIGQLSAEDADLVRALVLRLIDEDRR
jgi:hypothetical protein